MRAIWSQRWEVVLALALASAPAALGQTPAWTWAGPAALAAPLPASELFASPMAALALPLGAPPGSMLAGGLGGVWRLESGSWQPISPGQPVSALAMSSDGVTIFAGTGDAIDAQTRAGGGVLVSADGGQTWALQGAASLGGLAIAALAPDPSQPQHLLAAAELAADSPAGLHPGVYGSRDGGTTWALVLAGNFTALAWQAGQGTTVIAAGPSGVELSSDGGQTFSILPAGLPAAIVNAAACPLSDGGFEVLLAATNGASLWQFSAAGAGETATLPAGFSPVSLALADSADALWVGGGNGVWSSSNGGQTWTAATAAGTLAAGGEHALLVSSSGVWLANDAGVWNQAGGGWRAMAQGLSNAAPVAFASSNGNAVAALDVTGLAAGPLGNSASWAQVTGAPALLALAAAPTPSTDLFGLGSPGILWQSADGGSTWAPMAMPAGISGVPTALVISSAGLWLGSSTGQVLGPSGQLAVLPAAISALSAGADLWAAAGTRLIASSDGGQTWTQEGLAPAPVAALAADPLRPQVVVVAATTGVFASLDGGTSWASLDDGLPSTPVTALEFDPSETLWAATFGRGVWSLPFASSQTLLTLSPVASSPPVGSPLDLEAKLIAFGVPVAGATVTFAASVDGKEGWTAAVATDANGIAQVNFTPTQAQATTIAAAADGASATTSLTPAPLAPASLAVSGVNQSVLEGHTLPVSVTVLDAYSNPVPGAVVSFAAPAGSFSPSQATADASGVAATTFTLPPVAGTVALSAASGAATASWSETALPPPDFVLLLTPPTAAATPNQVATLSLQVAAIGGYASAVPLICDSPPGACTVSPASVMPGQSAVVSVNVGAWDDDEQSVAVQVSSQGTHAVMATLSLQAFTLAASESVVSVGAGASSAPVTLTVTPVNGLAAPLTLSIALSDGSPLPSALTAAFQPPNATLANGSPAMVELTLSAGTASSVNEWWLAWLGLLLVATLLRPKRRAVPLGALAALTLALAACGGATPVPMNTDPPPTTTSYALVITANASGLSASTPLSVAVTQ